MGQHRTVEQQIADTEARLAQLNKKQRAAETRRKILLGAFIEQKMKANSGMHQAIMTEMNEFLTRDADRRLFNLPLTEKKPK